MTLLVADPEIVIKVAAWPARIASSENRSKLFGKFCFQNFEYNLL